MPGGLEDRHPPAGGTHRPVGTLRASGRGLLLLAALAPGCRPAGPGVAPEGPSGPPWFADVTEEAGLHFVHDPGPLGSYFLPQVMGSGAALFDFDGDGLL